MADDIASKGYVTDEEAVARLQQLINMAASWSADARAKGLIDNDKDTVQAVPENGSTDRDTARQLKRGIREVGDLAARNRDFNRYLQETFHVGNNNLRTVTNFLDYRLSNDGGDLQGIGSEVRKLAMASVDPRQATQAFNSSLSGPENVRIRGYQNFVNDVATAFPQLGLQQVEATGQWNRETSQAVRAVAGQSFVLPPDTVRETGLSADLAAKLQGSNYKADMLKFADSQDAQMARPAQEPAATSTEPEPEPAATATPEPAMASRPAPARTASPAPEHREARHGSQIYRNEADVRTIENFLQKHGGHTDGKADGVAHNATNHGIVDFVMTQQAALAKKGYDTGTIDGLYGEKANEQFKAHLAEVMPDVPKEEVDAFTKALNKIHQDGKTIPEAKSVLQPVRTAEEIRKAAALEAERQKDLQSPQQAPVASPPSSPAASSVNGGAFNRTDLAYTAPLTALGLTTAVADRAAASAGEGALSLIEGGRPAEPAGASRVQLITTEQTVAIPEPERAPAIGTRPAEPAKLTAPERMNAVSEPGKVVALRPGEFHAPAIVTKAPPPARLALPAPPEIAAPSPEAKLVQAFKPVAALPAPSAPHAAPATVAPSVPAVPPVQEAAAVAKVAEPVAESVADAIPEMEIFGPNDFAPGAGAARRVEGSTLKDVTPPSGQPEQAFEPVKPKVTDADFEIVGPAKGAAHETPKIDAPDNAKIFKPGGNIPDVDGSKLRTFALSPGESGLAGTFEQASLGSKVLGYGATALKVGGAALAAAGAALTAKDIYDLHANMDKAIADGLLPREAKDEYNELLTAHGARAGMGLTIVGLAPSLATEGIVQKGFEEFRQKHADAFAAHPELNEALKPGALTETVGLGDKGGKWALAPELKAKAIALDIRQAQTLQTNAISSGGDDVKHLAEATFGHEFNSAAGVAEALRADADAGGHKLDDMAKSFRHDGNTAAADALKAFGEQQSRIAQLNADAQKTALEIKRDQNAPINTLQGADNVMQLGGV